MNSLRTQLLLWLLPAYLLSAAAILAANWLHYRDSTGAFMDGQMHRLALAYAEQLQRDPRPPTLPSLDAEHVEHDGTVIVQFWGRDGLLGDTWSVPGLDLQTAEGFHSLNIQGHAWRVYTAAAGAWPRVQLLQSGDFRARVVLDSALEAAGPVAFLIPVTVLLLWLAVFLALRPVNRLVQAIAAQDEHHLAELPLQRVPTELRPLIGSMNGLLARLKEAFASQQRFVQDAAHELRTPLTALKLQVENLQQKLGAAAGEDIGRLEAGIERMQRLVEQLLRLARQEAAPLQDTAQEVDLGLVLKESLHDLVPLAEARGIDLGLTVAEPAVVCADARDLRSVFDNLLDNALRYTPAGGRVDVSLRQADGALQVEFLDTGPGIPPELLERVFDRFYRVLGSGTQGSGLGLAIANNAAGRGGMHIELFNRGDRSGLLARVRFGQGLSPA
ncbi:MAG TPA: ATP-binding protein [Gammaproteobacteria bacterium]|nr:ATP-binding protein [Gammaproteobacteria bacterium]